MFDLPKFEERKWWDKTFAYLYFVVRIKYSWSINIKTHTTESHYAHISYLVYFVINIVAFFLFSLTLSLSLFLSYSLTPSGIWCGKFHQALIIVVINRKLTERNFEVIYKKGIAKKERRMNFIWREQGGQEREKREEREWM